MSSRAGVAFGLGAYVLWGAFPLYFPLLAPAGSLEVLAHRVVWSLAVCALALTAASAVPAWRAGGWRPVLALARSPRQVGLLAVAAGLIAVNWGVYIYATTSGHVVEASLGYFVNPLVTVALAVLVLGERLRRLQRVAVAIGAAGVVVLTVDHGRPPWIAVVLALSFGGYGLAKTRLGAGLGALTSLTAETLLLAPAALAFLAWLEGSGRGTFALDAPAHPLLLASAGVVTAVPLLLFAAAARRVPLTTTGLLQYVTPVLQLALGVLVLGEHVPPSRWVGFAFVWAALAVLTADLLGAGRRAAPAAPGPARLPSGTR
ncbi:EamA family transporter RarD [Quadrisphaera sp. DSM 44207]|uniref:EamA family transporter RarD n=1 Tax=Quadrisphaera sp. DSM 44207 TaxID=1881057 RepID=UPI00087E9FF7|nr:EamA family transporter RarD [Quadrisphaera sp. DSM 44207]SDQ15102.1 chloramphenicol-sensitive protein RarD [Quadrisphaera sp. DSM 44207]